MLIWFFLGGECVYFGDIGFDFKVLIDYFEWNGVKVLYDVNFVEFMFEVIGVGFCKCIGSDWGEKWRNLFEFVEVKCEI